LVLFFSHDSSYLNDRVKLEAAKDTASKVSQQSELVELYVALIDINGM
jgi:hypothetical protein